MLSLGAILVQITFILKAYILKIYSERLEAKVANLKSSSELKMLAITAVFQ